MRKLIKLVGLVALSPLLAAVFLILGCTGAQPIFGGFCSWIGVQFLFIALTLLSLLLVAVVAVAFSLRKPF